MIFACIKTESIGLITYKTTQTHRGEDGHNAKCLKLKAELPIERWLGFFVLERGEP